MSGTWRQRTLRALPMTVGIHLVFAGLAAGVAALWGPPMDTLPPAPDMLRALLERLVREPMAARAYATTWALCGLALWLAVPWLRMAWLRALATGQTVRECTAFAHAHWWRAALRSLVVSAVALLGAGLPLALAWSLRDRIAATSETHQLQLWLTAATPALLWLVACLIWHDLEHADLCVDQERRLRDMLRSFGRTWRVRAWGVWLLYALLVGALSTAAVAATRSGASFPTLAVAQLLLLTRTVARSGWLAHATRLAAPRVAR